VHCTAKTVPCGDPPDLCCDIDTPNHSVPPPTPALPPPEDHAGTVSGAESAEAQSIHVEPGAAGCKECGEKFKRAGGCFAVMEGKDPSSKIPADCEHCAGELVLICHQEAQRDKEARMLDLSQGADVKEAQGTAKKSDEGASHDLPSKARGASHDLPSKKPADPNGWTTVSLPPMAPPTPPRGTPAPSMASPSPTTASPTKRPSPTQAPTEEVTLDDRLKQLVGSMPPNLAQLLAREKAGQHPPGFLEKVRKPVHDAFAQMISYYAGQGKDQKALLRDIQEELDKMKDRAAGNAYDMDEADKLEAITAFWKQRMIKTEAAPVDGPGDEGGSTEMEEGEDGLLSLACTKCGNQFKENGGCQGLRKANGDKDQIQQIMAGMGQVDGCHDCGLQTQDSVLQYVKKVRLCTEPDTDKQGRLKSRIGTDPPWFHHSGSTGAHSETKCTACA